MTEQNGALEGVVIERTFDAPIGTIWEMWTNSEQFRQWYGPTGASIPVAEIDLRVGGKRLVCMEMSGPNGPMQMWFAGEFREVVPNRRLVYTDHLSDETGSPISPSEAGMPGGHPETTEVMVDLEDLGGSTRMILSHIGIPADSPGAAGWAMALDKLATETDG